QGFNHLQVGLNRVTTVLKRAQKPQEQMRNLHRLDWSAMGVVYASQKVNYQYVSADMQLNASYELALMAFNSRHQMIHYQQYEHYNAKPFWHIKLAAMSAEDLKLLLNFTLVSFYRFVGNEYYAAPMQVYQQLLDALNLPSNYLVIKEGPVTYRDNVLVKTVEPRPQAKELILIQLLPIIAYATTGERGLDRLPAQEALRVQQLKQFIHALYECARAMSHDAEMNKHLAQINAVSDEKLFNLLRFCAEVYPQSSTMGEGIALDLGELTQILIRIKQSRNCNINDKDLTKLAADLEWQFADVFWRMDHELLVTTRLVKNYKQYFIDALSRLTRYNSQG
ncbi:MAG TPA: hypothetical protein VI522_01805, partial [Gammaproteobacteria bacterium]|nr:hypothetical protein [Gammaproteobacteria bacterium]